MVTIEKLIDDAKGYEVVRDLRWPKGVDCPNRNSQNIKKRSHHDRTAGHKGQPEVVASLGRKGRRRKLRGKRGRGALVGEKPLALGMLQRNGEVVIQLVPNVQQVTIQPLEVVKHIILEATRQGDPFPLPNLTWQIHPSAHNAARKAHPTGWVARTLENFRSVYRFAARYACS